MHLPQLLTNRDWERRLPAELKPAERGWLRNQLAALFALYPAPDMPRAAWDAVVEQYMESLYEYPPSVIAETFKTARETCKFRPSIAELVEIGRPLLRAARERHRGPPGDNYRPTLQLGYNELTPKQKAQHDATVAKFLRKVTTMPSPTLKPLCLRCLASEVEKHGDFCPPCAAAKAAAAA